MFFRTTQLLRFNNFITMLIFINHNHICIDFNFKIFIYLQILSPHDHCIKIPQLTVKVQAIQYSSNSTSQLAQNSWENVPHGWASSARQKSWLSITEVHPSQESLKFCPLRVARETDCQCNECRGVFLQCFRFKPGQASCVWRHAMFTTHRNHGNHGGKAF